MWVVYLPLYVHVLTLQGTLLLAKKLHHFISISGEISPKTRREPNFPFPDPSVHAQMDSSQAAQPGAKLYISVVTEQYTELLYH